MPLERLAAGHLALNLIPDLWPTVGRSRWRKLGPGDVLECSIGCAEWAAHLLQASPLVSEDEPHNHNLTEASLELGKMAFHAVLCASARTVEMMSNSVPPPTRSTTTSAAGHGISQTDGGTFDDGGLVGASRHLGRRQVAANAPTVPGSIRLEPRRSTTLVRKASRAALAALSVSLGVLCGAVEASVGWDGRRWLLSEAMGGPRPLHFNDLGFDELASRPRGAEVRPSWEDPVFEWNAGLPASSLAG